MKDIEILVEENRYLKQELKDKNRELASVKAQLDKMKNKSRGNMESGNYSNVFIMPDDFTGADESLFCTYDGSLLEIDTYDKFGMCDYDNEYANTKTKKSKMECKPKLTREQEQRVISYLKRKKYIQVTQKLRDDLFKKFDVSLTDKGIRDLMKRNGIYKGGKYYE